MPHKLYLTEFEYRIYPRVTSRAQFWQTVGVGCPLSRLGKLCCLPLLSVIFIFDSFSYCRLPVSFQAFVVIDSITHIYIDRYILQAKTA